MTMITLESNSNIKIDTAIIDDKGSIDYYLNILFCQLNKGISNEGFRKE